MRRGAPRRRTRPGKGPRGPAPPSASAAQPAPGPRQQPPCGGSERFCLPLCQGAGRGRRRRCWSPRPWCGTGPGATSGARRGPAPRCRGSARRRRRCSASPQRRTDMLTGCQLHPSSSGDVFERAATARLARRPAARPRGQPLPRRARSPGSCSVTAPARASPLRAAPPALVPCVFDCGAAAPAGMAHLCIAPSG